MKTYTVTFTIDDNGNLNLSRTNDGFNVAELLGLTEILRDDIFRQLIRKKEDGDRPKVEARHERVCIKRDKTD